MQPAKEPQHWLFGGAVISEGSRSLPLARPPRAAIFGVEGPRLSDWEREFFRDADPLGFILFARNCVDRDQVRRLTGAMRDCVGRADAPVLIDQEGGRVARLKPPVWPIWPAPRRFGELAARDRPAALDAVRMNARSLGLALTEVGVDVDCAPLADLLLPGAHDVIGDRAFDSAPDLVGALCGGAIDGFFSAGVIPVIKHVPGHGRALVDSHRDLPRVAESADMLDGSDFQAFRGVGGDVWGMTAHVVYEAIDADRPATTSGRIIADIVRDTIGFDGLLLTDDLSMKALGGSFEDRTRESLNAGCDIVLHCNGDQQEMQSIAEVVPSMTARATRRYEQSRTRQRWSFSHSEDSVEDLQTSVAELLERFLRS